MRQQIFRSVFSALLCLFLNSPTARAADPIAYVTTDDVRVVRKGDGFHIEVDMLAPVPQALAWQVLTDFSAMASFVGNLESSKVIESNGHRLRVEQRGTARWGLFSLKFDSVRDIELRPMSEILAKQISGTSRQMSSRMVVKAMPDNQTRLEYRAEIVPESGLPPFFGPMVVRDETAEQFSTVIQEMVRRASVVKSR